ncbi:MAG: glutathione S-transferase [Litoreibacter sp.]
MTRPILYSFRRCPYAIRARLAIKSAGLQPEHREILLRDKASEFLAASPKGTVPVVVDGTRVIDESFDVMLWALNQNDPENLLSVPSSGHALIEINDTTFKRALDRTKYAHRHQSDPEVERANAQPFIDKLGQQLGENDYLFDGAPSLADYAILPFIRQFANIDRERFNRDAPQGVQNWLDRFLDSTLFTSIMQKYPKWEAGDPVTLFPPKG